MPEIESTPHIETTSRAHEQMQQQLGPEGMRQLGAQLDIWHGLNQAETLPSPLRDSLKGGSALLPKGTLMWSIVGVRRHPYVENRSRH